jgi:hypothetical protein
MEAVSQRRLSYEVIPDRDTPGVWRAEAIDMDGDGACWVVIFATPSAEVDAREYARWKNGSVMDADGQPQ